jgi:predicted secreted protein
MSRQRRIAEDPTPARPLRVIEGAEFDVTLADLPGAGYIWTSAAVPDGLTMVGDQLTEAEPDVVGAAQHRVLRYRAHRAGDYELVFTLARPWEDSPAETRKVRVRVRPREAEQK